MANFLKKHRWQIICTLISSLCFGIIWRGYSLTLPSLYDKKIDFKLEDISSKVGIYYKHSFNIDLAHHEWQKEMKNVYGWISSQGSSVSVVDINNDDWPDIFFPSSTYGMPNHLYINQQNGTFKEEAAFWGLDFIPGTLFTSRAIFFDANNDGTKDVFVMSESCPKLLMQYEAKKFSEVRLNLDATSCNFSISVNVLDINNDGYLDVVFSGITGIGFLRAGEVPESFVNANNGSTTTILLNDAKGGFITQPNVIERQSFKRFTNAIGVGDFFGDSFFDLWFGTDFSNDEVYQNVHGKFSKPVKMKGSLAKSAMAVESTYLDGYIPYIFISHVYNSYFYPYGNNLWQYDGTDFVDKSDDFGINNCGWAWGARFGDFNNDGKMDLYVANGFFGDELEKEQNYWYNLVTVSATYQKVVSNARFWPEMKGRNLSGKEQDCFFLNENNKQFHNISARSEILADKYKKDGRGVALIDFMNSGSLGIIVSNQKEKPYFLQTTQHNEHSWIGFKFRGKRSNRDGIGVKAKLYKTNGETIIQQLNPFNGYAAQSDARLHYGLGEEKSQVKLEVSWPSGIKQIIEGLKINQYHLIEEVI